MSITATVKDGIIRLPEELRVPDGTEVTVEIQKLQPFAERFGKYLGAAESETGDLAANHDHYLYGTPKRGA